MQQSLPLKHKVIHLVGSERDELENPRLWIRHFPVDVHVEDVAGLVADAQTDDDARRLGACADRHSDFGVFHLQDTF